MTPTINWATGTWQPGSQARFHDMQVGNKASYFTVYPGLYWYSGLGSGTFFRPDGTMLLDCSPQEADAEARRLGINCHFVDSFINTGRSTFVGD
jgi:hypothetical protein